MMLAMGAMACAHSMSSEASISQSGPVVGYGPLGSVPGKRELAALV